MTPGTPLPPELLFQLGTLSPLQLAWLSGYCWSQCTQADAMLRAAAGLPLATPNGAAGIPSPFTGQHQPASPAPAGFAQAGAAQPFFSQASFPQGQPFPGQFPAGQAGSGQPSPAGTNPATGATTVGTTIQQAAPAAGTAAPRRITILSASQTGNARRVAQQLHDSLKDAGLQPGLTSVGDYKSKTLPDEDIVLLVTSTQGEGEPPEEAVPLHKFLFGKKSPKLDALHFAVLGLGDSSYPKFCQAGRDFDTQLEKLGAQRLHERTDCDLDFQATATAWVDAVTEKLQKITATPQAGAVGAATAGTSGTPGQPGQPGQQPAPGQPGMPGMPGQPGSPAASPFGFPFGTPFNNPFAAPAGGFVPGQGWPPGAGVPPAPGISPDIYPNVPAFAAFQGVNAAAALTPDAVTATAATATPAAEPAVSAWTRNAPFTATLSTRQKITSRNAEKDVQHIEIDLEGSGIQYQPGDALGVWPVNAPALVSEILDRHKLDGTETVKLADGSEASLRDALTHHADITQNTPTLVEQYAALSKLRPLQELVEDRKALDALLATTPPVGLFAEYPHPLPAQQLFSLFRPQSPRLYSIASAQDEVGDAVHLTVGVVHLRHHGQHYMGAASGYLGHLLEEDDDVRVFIEPNRNFRLPADDDTPIIMIGAGTGVAPFRAFMQQRDAAGATGKNWLIFGNQRFTDDFLYQAEWLQYRKSGLLTRADLAWSRQGEHKVYVQHKLQEAGAEVWQWLQEGAHVYVCGDAGRMARDVENTLLDIIRTHGKLDEDDADDYLNTLREDRRYQRDVY